MRRVLPFLIATLAVLSTNVSFGQGLLGRGHVSAQYLLVNLEDHGIPNFDGIDHGGRGTLNVPFIPTDESRFLGVDYFLSGYGYHIADRVGILNDTDFHLTNSGVETGATVYANLCDCFKPFGQVGVQNTWLNGRLSDGITTLKIKDTETSFIFGGGAEISLIPNTSWQSSVLFGSEFLGKTEFRNDVVVHANESWFLKFSFIANTDSDFIGGIGTGLSW